MDFRPDRFDNVTSSERVGVHRAKPRIGSKRISFLIAAFASMILIFAGIAFIALQPKSVDFSKELGESSQPQAPQVVAKLDPDASIMILNGSTVDDLAFFVDDFIVDEEIGKILASGDADDRTVKTSAVFFSDPKFEAAAMALGVELGGVKSYINSSFDSFGADLVLLLGDDYRGPGYEEALVGGHTRSSEGLDLNPDADVFADADADGSVEGYWEEQYY